MTDPESELLLKVAYYLLSIYPNPATCECGFLTIGQLFEKHLNLKFEILESMYKLIIIANFKTELGYYRIDQKKNIRLSNKKINIHIVKAFNETDDNDDNDPAPIYKSISAKKSQKTIIIF